MKTYEKPQSRVNRRGKFTPKFCRKLTYVLYRHTNHVRPIVLEAQAIWAEWSDDHQSHRIPGSVLVSLWKSHTDVFNRALEDGVLVPE
jgi:hypothetical protein